MSVRTPYTQTEEYLALRGGRPLRPSRRGTAAVVEIPPGPASTWTADQYKAVVDQRCRDLLAAWHSGPPVAPPPRTTPVKLFVPPPVVRKKPAPPRPAPQDGVPAHFGTYAAWASGTSSERIFAEPDVPGGPVPEPQRTRMRGAEDGYLYGKPQEPTSKDYMLGHAFGVQMRERHDEVLRERPIREAAFRRRCAENGALSHEGSPRLSHAPGGGRSAPMDS